jgi:hypothetical protein
LTLLKPNAGEKSGGDHDICSKDHKDDDFLIAVLGSALFTLVLMNQPSLQRCHVNGVDDLERNNSIQRKQV